jgi:aminoglycoside phosphotransferase (APT) family kinase protein
MLDGGDAATIADVFQLGEGARLSGPVARGEVGQVWRLSTALGEWAVKEPFEQPSPEEAEDDASFQELVRSHGVPMPQVVRTEAGDVLADVGGATVRVYGWVELLAREAWLDPATVGRLVASIHSVRYVGQNPVHPWYTDPVGADAWDDLIGRLDAAGADFAESLAQQRDELVGLEKLLEWPANLQTCHRDLFADNVLRTPMGSLCVIDWENSGLADVSQELGLVLFEFSCGDIDRARQLYDAYIDAGGPGRVERPGTFSMVIAQLGHIGEISCRRWLDPARSAEQQHNAGRVDEFLSQPITRRMIDELVAALAH